MNQTCQQWIRFTLVLLLASGCGNLALAETETLQPISPTTAEPSSLAALHVGQHAFNAGNYKQAFVHWQTLATQGHTDAQVFLGLAYAKGWGVDRSPKLARLWYRKAAEQGNTSGQFLLGLELIDGQRTEHATGVMWLQRAAEQGDSSAQVFLDKARARGWFRDVAPAASDRDIATLALPGDNID